MRAVAFGALGVASLVGWARRPVRLVGWRPPRAVSSTRAPHDLAARWRDLGDLAADIWRPGLVGEQSDKLLYGGAGRGERLRHRLGRWPARPAFGGDAL